MNIIDKLRNKLNLENGTTQPVTNAVNDYYSSEGYNFAKVWNTTRGLTKVHAILFDGVNDIAAVVPEINCGEYLKYNFDIKTSSNVDNATDQIFYGTKAGASASIYIKNGLLTLKHGGSDELCNTTLINDDKWHSCEITLDMIDKESDEVPDSSIIVDGTATVSGTLSANESWTSFSMAVIGGATGPTKAMFRDIKLTCSDGVKAHWLLDEASGDKIYDYVGGYTGTITNAADLDNFWVIERDSAASEGR